jgi:uncharacterized damage-inducible protein DinB
MLTYARHTTLTAVEGLTCEQLDRLHDEQSNSIGGLLAHIAAAERWYQLVTFEERRPTAAENDAWSAAWSLAIRGAARSVDMSCSSTSTTFSGYARNSGRACGA